MDDEHKKKEVRSEIAEAMLRSVESMFRVGAIDQETFQNFLNQHIKEEHSSIFLSEDDENDENIT